MLLIFIEAPPAVRLRAQTWRRLAAVTRHSAGLAVQRVMRLAATAAVLSATTPLGVHAEEALDIDVSGSHRLRYEFMANGPRPTASKTDDILVSRLFLNTRINKGTWFGQFEIQDSRGWLHGGSTPLGTDDINTLEPVQALVGWRGTENIPLQISVGRFTKNLSTRRLVARNRYRNTTNGFTGIDIKWQGPEWTINSFLSRPVLRRPTDRAALAGNQFELDETSPGQRFWGIEIKPSVRASWSAHLLGLHEEDRPDYPSRNRQLVTAGGQWRNLSINGGWEQAAEIAVQAGTSRATAGDVDTRDLDHFAWFMHGEVGYRWQHRWLGRVSGMFDYASGDRDRLDGNNERFDNLFGARRFDFGPTGIYGPQGRSNMITPGLRWDAHPTRPTFLMVAWRGFWLAETFDTQEGTGVLETLKGERYVGQQIEARLRHAITDYFQLETGAAYLIKGPILEGDLFNTGDKNTTYLYLQTTLRF